MSNIINNFGNQQFPDNIRVNHFKSISGGITFESTAGDPPDIYTVTSENASDSSGTVTIQAHGMVLAGQVCEATFNRRYSEAPVVILTPRNETAAESVYYVNSTVETFSIYLLSGLDDGEFVTFNYFVIEPKTGS